MEEEQKERLSAYSDRTGIPQAEVIRRAVDNFLYIHGSADEKPGQPPTSTAPAR